jgi:hypothetical protein
MGTAYRYIVNAVGKNGETYHTHFEDKQDLKKWITDREDKLLMNQLKVVDKDRPRFLKWLPVKIV